MKTIKAFKKALEQNGIYFEETTDSESFRDRLGEAMKSMNFAKTQTGVRC